MVFSLSQADVTVLLADHSTHVRAEVAGKLAQELDNPLLTESELRMAQDIVRIMAKDVESTVRRALSQGLRHSRRLPHDVALRFAKDVERVALPTLIDSCVLTDDDLVAIVRGSCGAKQEAIAGRSNLSEEVSGVLIASAQESAVAALMRNQAARISETSLGAAVERFAGSAIVKESIVKRENLPPKIAERLVALVSVHLKNYLVSHHELPTSVATDIVLQAREQATLDLSSGCHEEDLEQLVRQMHLSRRLTPFLLLRALCLGDMDFVEVALAVMANVPIANSRLLIHDAGPNGLKSLIERAELPPRLFTAVRIAVDVVKGTRLDGEEHDRERYRARVIARILTQFENFAQDDLEYLLDKLGDVLTLGYGVCRESATDSTDVPARLRHSVQRGPTA
jgi:uncharacterized protein (DUF2336 family)